VTAQAIATAGSRIVLGHQRRRLLWFAVTRHLTAEWLARQITEAFPWDTAPKYLIRDNHRAFGGAFKVRIRAMGIRDRPEARQRGNPRVAPLSRFKPLEFRQSRIAALALGTKGSGGFFEARLSQACTALAVINNLFMTA